MNIFLQCKSKESVAKNWEKAIHGDEQQALIIELQQQVQLSTLINQINQEIRSTLDLDEILNSASRLLGEALSCDRVCILIAEPEDREFLTIGGEYNRKGHVSQLGLKIPIANYPHLRMLVQQVGAPTLTQFTDFSRIGEPATELMPSVETRSILTRATYYQGQTNGVIELHDYQSLNSQAEAAYCHKQCSLSRAWQAWEEKLLEGVGSQLAVAIHQAQLHHQICRQAERESLLRLIINQIRQTLDLDTILQTAVREVRQLLSTSRVIIYQFLEDWQGKVIVEDIGSDWSSVLGEMSSDNCFHEQYAHLYRGGRVRAIHDIHQAGLDSCHINFLQQFQVKANAIVPILIGSNLWGLLIAHECQSPRVWQTWEIELLQYLGHQIAIAIQQSQLYSQSQASAAQARIQTEQLEATLKELQATQMQLIQSEKLSSLGQMVAGVAHEINNAINFVYANLPHAQNYARFIEQALNIYEAAYPDFAALNTDSELSYIREDFPKLLESMQEGTERIREIVLSLQSFSRLDQAKCKPVDLHEGIENTLVILQHRLKNSVKLNKHYGCLPKVNCHAGQINQVFLNILANALDAVGEQAELTICTRQNHPEWVTVSIRDNGSGIPPEIQSRIFDPFFTTKEVGKGTGLGLSICHQIICQGHKGHIRCTSQLGKGTEFYIELPISAGSEF